MAGETCIDLNFMDMLSKIEDCAPITSDKKSYPNGYLNSFNCSFDNISNRNLTSNTVNDASDDDLTALLDSHQSRNHESSGLISLEALAKSHFSNNLSWSLGKEHEKVVQDPFLFDLKDDSCDGLKSFDCLKDILLEKNSDEGSESTLDILNTLNLEHSSDKSFDLSKRNHELKSKEETSDDEFIQDIDLCFCIKKNNDEDEFSPVSSSLDSKDSGFYESDFSPVQYISNSSDKPSSNENLFGDDQVKFNLANAKQSLLSRSIAAKPNIDKTRREKLNNIRSELLKKYIPQSFSKREKKQKLQKIQCFIDQSNQCVVTSNFMTLY